MIRLLDIPVGVTIGRATRPLYFQPGDHEELVAQIEAGLDEKTPSDAAEILLLVALSDELDAMPFSHENWKERCEQCANWCRRAHSLCRESDPTMALRAGVLLFGFEAALHFNPSWDEVLRGCKQENYPYLEVDGNTSGDVELLKAIEVAEVLVSTHVSRFMFKFVYDPTLSDSEVRESCKSVVEGTINSRAQRIWEWFEYTKEQGLLTDALASRSFAFMSKLTKVSEALAKVAGFENSIIDLPSLN
ncbi:MAG: hypothetical protein Q7K33_01595 [Candidatus Berkelbacteria bacterium]|nr:hypothetical protein [Candidatus Berkelbacteria bacterium]